MAELKSAAKMPHLWTHEDTLKFLKLMKGNGTRLSVGYFNRIKKKEQAAVMKEYAEELQMDSVDVYGAQVDTKWKSLLSTFQSTKDHNSKTGNNPKKESPHHDEMLEIMGC